MKILGKFSRLSRKICSFFSAFRRRWLFCCLNAKNVIDRHYKVIISYWFLRNEEDRCSVFCVLNGGLVGSAGTYDYKGVGVYVLFGRLDIEDNHGPSIILH